MTLILGLRGKDGVVLAADSRGTIGDPRGLTAIDDTQTKLFQLGKYLLQTFDLYTSASKYSRIFDTCLVLNSSVGMKLSAYAKQQGLS
jgi:Resolvase, N terminal domain